MKDFDESEDSIVLATEKGVVKKTKLADFKNYRKGGIIGIKIDEGDNLVGARLTTGEDEICLVTSNAQSIRFSETDLRDQGHDHPRRRLRAGPWGPGLRCGDGQARDPL